MPMPAPIAAGLGACAVALAACGGGVPAHRPGGAPTVAAVGLSSAPAPCRAVAARTLRTIAARIEARAAADPGGKRGGRPAAPARPPAPPGPAGAPGAR